MRISIALATFDGSAFVGEQIFSLLDQSRLPDEIVVSDDGSSDNTVNIIRASATAASGSMPTFRFLENSGNVGVTRNFERAIAACSGDIIFLCDQDDFWMREKIELMAIEFEKSPELLMLFSDAILVDEGRRPFRTRQTDALNLSSKEKRALHSGDLLEALLIRNLVTGCTVAFRKELAELAAPFPQNWVHDEWLAAVAASLDGIRMLKFPLVEYRQHASNKIGMKRAGLFAKMRKIVSSRGSFYIDQHARIQYLANHVRRLGTRVPAAHLQRLTMRLAHARFRAGLPPERSKRFFAVLNAALSGDYHRHSRGLQSIIRDLIEPP